MPVPSSTSTPAGWRYLAGASSALFFSYAALCLPLDRWVPLMGEWYGEAAIFIAATALAFAAVRFAARKSGPSQEATKMLMLSTSVLLISFLSVDVGFKVYTNRSPDFQFDPNALLVGRTNDPNMWDSELSPRTYAPTEANFLLYKPNQVRSAPIFGEHYYPALLGHPVLRDNVLERIDLAFHIDRFGMRNQTPPAANGIAVLGDSFVFGYGMTEDAIFPTLMAQQLGESVYNLGVSGSSPGQQFFQLDYLLRTHPEAFKLRRLLWLIFEGNDLEDDYSPTALREHEMKRSLGATFDGTLVHLMREIPRIVKEQSVIRRLVDGEVRLRSFSSDDPDRSHYVLDGEIIAYPLYHSDRFGYRLFRQVNISRARQPRSYVENHPNLPRLAATVEKMAELSRRAGFEVTVVTVPSAVRLYADPFGVDGVPTEPYFIQAVMALAAEQDLDYLDLHELLAPAAAKEMVHRRDDTHWNARGHQLVADALSAHLRNKTTSARPASAIQEGYPQ